MKIISWNVAGLRACLKKGLPEFFEKEDADIYCFQEVKATKDQYDFNPSNYHEYLFPAVKKGYSGTMIYSKEEPLSVKYGIGMDAVDNEGRVITLEFPKFYMVTVYSPNTKRDLSRLAERMVFEDNFRKYLNQLKEEKTVIVCGDLNVAHEEIDLKNYKTNKGNSGFTIEERDKFTELLNSGFIDTFRYFNPTLEGAYTWWNYMFNSRANNTGWRIDYFLVSKDDIKKVNNSIIYSDVLGSDHCPIGLDINI